MRLLICRTRGSTPAPFDGTATIASLSDRSPATEGTGPDGMGEYHAATPALAHDADLFIHDAQYTPEEFPAGDGFGHSVVDLPR